MQGTEVLAQSRDVYPLARRVLLTAYSDIDAAIKAINDAHLDHYLSKPWDPPEECLFPVVDDLLDAWQAEYLPEAKGLRLVGHQWSPRSHAIKDFLAGNLIPYRWLDVERDPDARGAARRGRRRRRRAAGAVLRGRHGAAQPGAAPGRRAPRPIAVGVARSLRPRDRGRRSGRARRRGVRRLGRTADAAARSACAGRPGGQQLADRELSRVPGRRQRQRADAARGHAGAAARRRVPRAARSHGRVDRRRLQAPDAQRRPRDRHAHDAGRDRHGVSRASGAGRRRRSPAPASTTARRRPRRRRSPAGACSSSAAATRRDRRAMYLSRYARDVQIVVRRDSLRDTMSQYLIEQIEKTPNIRLQTADRARARRGQRPRRARRR